MSDTRVPRRRRFLVCEPRHFAVQYAINPWMHPDTHVDVDLAQEQWRTLIRAYRAHGHTVDTVEPVPGLPDMVFAANSAVVVGGRVFGSLFHAPAAAPRVHALRPWFKTAGYDVHRPGVGLRGRGRPRLDGPVRAGRHRVPHDPGGAPRGAGVLRRTR